MSKFDIAVAVYDSHVQAEDAVDGGAGDIRRAREVLSAAGSTDVQSHAGTQ